MSDDGGRVLARFTLAPGDTVVLGRDAACDIVVDDDEIAPRCFEAQAQIGGASLRALQMQGPFVRDHWASDNPSIGDDATFAFGACTIAVTVNISGPHNAYVFTHSVNDALRGTSPAYEDPGSVSTLYGGPPE